MKISLSIHHKYARIINPSKFIHISLLEIEVRLDMFYFLQVYIRRKSLLNANRSSQGKKEHDYFL